MWNVAHSYTTIKNFENQELPLERASGELLLYSKNTEMAVHMATATGDLRWQETYEYYQYELKQTLEEIPHMVTSEEVRQKTEKIDHNLEELSKIENQAFNLVSQGEKNKAWDLLSGWGYTSHHLRLNETTEELTVILDDHVNSRIAFVESITYRLILVVVVSLIALIVSWYISMKVWRFNSQKRKEKEEEITYLSYHDSLTGIYNRRYFEEEFQRLNVERLLPLTVVLGDVNDLKYVNDNYGHKKGDELLIEISRILKMSVRKEDIVARWGGDEFAIILPSTGYETAKQIVHRIEKNCEKSHYTPGPPSISMGFAVKTDTEESLDNIFVMAENRMYQKKKENSSRSC